MLLVRVKWITVVGESEVDHTVVCESEVDHCCC